MRRLRSWLRARLILAVRPMVHLEVDEVRAELYREMDDHILRYHT